MRTTMRELEATLSTVLDDGRQRQCVLDRLRATMAELAEHGLDGRSVHAGTQTDDVGKPKVGRPKKTKPVK